MDYSCTFPDVDCSACGVLADLSRRPVSAEGRQVGWMGTTSLSRVACYSMETRFGTQTKPARSLSGPRPPTPSSRPRSPVPYPLALLWSTNTLWVPLFSVHPLDCPFTPPCVRGQPGRSRVHQQSLAKHSSRALYLFVFLFFFTFAASRRFMPRLRSSGRQPPCPLGTPSILCFAAQPTTTTALLED